MLPVRALSPQIPLRRNLPRGCQETAKKPLYGASLTCPSTLVSEEEPQDSLTALRPRGQRPTGLGVPELGERGPWVLRSTRLLSDLSFTQASGKLHPLKALLQDGVSNELAWLPLPPLPLFQPGPSLGCFAPGVIIATFIFLSSGTFFYSSFILHSRKLASRLSISTHKIELAVVLLLFSIAQKVFKCCIIAL